MQGHYNTERPLRGHSKKEVTPVNVLNTFTFESLTLLINTFFIEM
jgi:hypothetical protein